MRAETTCNRRCFLRALGLGAAALALPRYAKGVAASAKKRPPNILLIVSDDQGYHDLGCYGSEDILTPNQDRLAKEGVRLTSFYVAWPACTPSRGSFLTGRYPQRNGTYDMYRNEKPDYGYKYPPDEYAFTPERILGMDTREVLLPKVLKPAGYTSGIYGKWDLGQLQRFLPVQRGFDDFYGFVNTGIDYYTHERYGVPSMYRNNEPTTEDKGEYCTWLFTREAKRFIRENKDRPFFCYVPYNAPHIASVLENPKPVQAPDEYKAMYPKPENEREARRVDYMAAVTAMDHAIGELLDLLDEIGQADNTIVIYFADNGGGGPADNSPLRGRKGQTYEGVVSENTVSDEFLTSMELFPTLCNAVGAPLPEGVVLDGFDAREILAGTKPSPRKEMFWVRRAFRGARVGNWKWVDMKGKGGLFDLSNDIGEEHDLSEEKPEVLQHVLSRFEAWKAEMEAAEPRRPFRDF